MKRIVGYLGILFIFATVAQAGVIVTTLTGGGSVIDAAGGYGPSIGWEFEVTVPLYVDALDYYYDDTFWESPVFDPTNPFSNDHPIAIYREADAQEMVSGVVTPSSLIHDVYWHYVTLPTPVFLDRGNYYIMAGIGADDYALMQTTVTTIPGVRWLMNAAGTTSPIEYPDRLDNPHDVTGFFGPSFEATAALNNAMTENRRLGRTIDSSESYWAALDALRRHAVGRPTSSLHTQ